MDRRFLLQAGGAVMALGGMQPLARAAPAPTRSFDVLFAALQADPDAAQAARKYSDYAESETSAACRDVILDGQPTCIITAARRPGRLKPSKAVVSRRASELIVFCEVTSKARYEQTLDHPVWPRLQSGVTIGIGYDLGYVEKEDFVKEWSPYLHPFTITELSQVVGKKGEDAQKSIPDVDYIKITWDDAYRQYTEILLPIFVAETEKFCENTGLLSPDSRGALVSLIINRGSSLRVDNDPLDRRKEMREIADLMRDKNFPAIPAKFIEMNRLWEHNPAARGLVLRRQTEAALFQAGLS